VAEVNKVELIADRLALFELRRAAMFSVDSIFLDFFRQSQYETFELEHLYHEAVVMKAAAYRFAKPDVMNKLFTAAVQALGYCADDFLIHPVFYLRQSKPRGESPNGALLDSQPHYDRSFGAHAESFWLALEDANRETGGLCFFCGPAEELFKIEWGESNRFNYDGYVLNSKAIDPLIKDHIIHPSLPAGFAYHFDSDTLHAATKPESAARLSFDFRIVRKSVVSTLDERSKLIIYKFNDNIALSNAKNLKILGDDLGVADLVNYFDLDREEIKNIPSQFSITKPFGKVAWRSEYSWI